jgi:ribosome-associated protein
LKFNRRTETLEDVSRLCTIQAGNFPVYYERTSVATSTIGQHSQASYSGRSLELAKAAARTAAENRGRDIVILDMREVTPVFDYFVLATGSSRRQLHAMSEEIDHKLEDDLGDHRMGVEGYQESRWILLDYGDVVVHLFEPEAREYYGLEDLWCDATRVPVDLPTAGGVN